MPIDFSPRVCDMGRRSGITKKLEDLSTNFNTLKTITRICKIYSTILEDIQQLDPRLLRLETKAIFRIVDEVQRKLLQKTFDEVHRSCDCGGGNRTGRDGSGTEESVWLDQAEPQLRELQDTLSRHRQRFDRTELSLATPIELLCRLVGVQLGRPDWDIGAYLSLVFVVHIKFDSHKPG